VNTHVYCERCRETKFVELSDNDIPKSGSGLKKKSLLHGDHILLIDIDGEGTVRNEQVVDILLNPIQTLINDVAQGFLFLNSDYSKSILIDAYTKNMNLSKFFQNIISAIFDQAIGLDFDNRMKVKAETLDHKTVLQSDRLQISVGPYIQEGIETLDNPQRGLIMDIKEAETNKLDIEQTMLKYDWVALLVPHDKAEGYKHAFASMLQAQKKPFFVDVINNSSLKQLFDFVLGVTYDHNFPVD
jgi:hypothetical protein